MSRLSLFLHLFLILFLTALTQIGGLLWALCFWATGWGKGKSKKRWSKALLGFIPLYLLTTFLLVPLLASVWGRTPLPVFSTASFKPVSLVYPLLNRHYVSVHTKYVLQEIAGKLQSRYPGAELRYLDAGLPFVDGFPLLPHLSHSDGRKVDLAFFYLQADGTPTNEKPSRSGYGIFEGPTAAEDNTAESCKNKGYWQYSYPQYLSMGQQHTDLTFDAKRTRFLLELLLQQPEVGKVFLEPHLQQRFGLAGAQKLRFHGCGAVRHDDHIHMQLN